MAGRHAVSLALALTGCGLILDTDPAPTPVPDAAVAMDASTLADGGSNIDATPRDPDADTPDGGVTADCVEDTTWREESFVASGLIDVASNGDEIAVVYHQAADRALVQMLDSSLTPVVQYPWDGTVGPSRLTTTSRGFALFHSYMTAVAVVEPPGGMRAMTSGVITTAALSRHDPPFPIVAAILFGPSFLSPGFMEIDYEASFVGVRSVPALGDGTRAIDARIEHSAPFHAYVVVFADPSAVRIGAFDDVSLEPIRPLVTLLSTTAAAVPTQPDLSLALSDRVAAVAMRVDRGGVVSAELATVTDTGELRVVSDPADPSGAMAIAARPGARVLGLARTVGDDLHFELRGWTDSEVLASLVVSASTEGDLLDVEAEPTPGSYLVARKWRDHGGPATVTRIRCRLGD